MDRPRILLTGADGTIGTAVHAELSGSGAEVITLGHQPGPMIDLVANFASDDDLGQAIGSITPSLDGLVFAHGMLEPGPVDRVPPVAWRHMLDMNLNSIYTIIHASLERLAENASIVIVSSTAAFDHSPVGGPHYSVSKWALSGLVRHLADDLGPRGIRVNSVCPGTVEGPMARALLGEPDYLASLQGIPLRRAADASEIADVVSFLLSRKASYATGANIPVSGGYR
ncbi:SDR family oxidoreductase [Mesorhizobium sp. M0622]